MSTYREIRRLVDILINTSAVQKRRSAGKELLEMMSKPEVRRRLASEARPKGSHVAVGRRHALSEVWRSIIHGVVAAVDDFAKGKTKLTVADVNMLFKFVQVCDIANEGFEEAYNTYKLSRKEVKLVACLCLDLLDDVFALAIAELQLLEMLAFICSRDEYVAHFRPDPEIQVILEEAEKRISAEDTDALPHGTLEAATKVFKNIINTAADSCITLNLFMPGAIKLVGGCCARNVANQENTRRVTVDQLNLISGVTHLIRSDPEQAIAPLTRHGRAILSFAKRFYGAGDMQRDVLNQYFKCHM